VEVKINDDETVTIVGRTNNSLTGILAGGLDTQANALDMAELLAVRLAVKAAPFPLGDGERVYRECLAIVNANADKFPDMTLGTMRRVMVIAAMGGCNAPNDAYLRIAYDIKTGALVNSY